ncbi:hypothetical protein H6790_01610 [Candidatus Nomurabacteria bacterium]|nr:hypothetical protein [Candidatus Nomurabacteria bacterium]
MRSNMIEIIPAIIPTSYTEIEEKIKKIEGQFERVQVDVVDGEYVPNISWPFNDSEFDFDFGDGNNEIQELPYAKYVDYEVDIMAKESHKYFDTFVNLGATRIILHLGENTDETKEFIEAVSNDARDGVQVGIAIHQEYDMSVVDKFANVVDFFQVMGIDKVGFQGHEFTQKTFEIIKYIKINYPEMEISVDGGVKVNMLEELEKAGVSRAVMGSGFWDNIE